MLGDTGPSASAKSAPDSAHCHGDLAIVVRRLQRSCPSADADDAVQSHANGR
jgi:hypothetical protein